MKRSDCIHMCDNHIVCAYSRALILAVSKENDIFPIAKKPNKDGRLVLSELENEFC